MDHPQMPSAAARQGLQSAWPWLLLGVWLMVSAAQIWALEVESVRRGEVCSATPAGLWKVGAR